MSGRLFGANGPNHGDVRRPLPPTGIGRGQAEDKNQLQSLSRNSYSDDTLRWLGEKRPRKGRDRELCLRPFRHRRSSSGAGEIYKYQEISLPTKGSTMSFGADERRGEFPSSPMQAGDASEPPPLIAEDDEEMTTHGSNEWATLCRAMEKPCDGIVPSQVQSRGRRVCGVATGSGDTVEDTFLPWLWKHVHPGLLLARGVQDKEEPMNWLVQTITHYRGMGRMGSTDLTWSHGTAMQQIELLRRGFFPRRDVIKW